MLDLTSEIWANALRVGMGARVVAVLAQGRSVQIAIFRAGPFRIAYPDFPAGAQLYDEADLAVVVDACRSERVDVIRLHVRSLGPCMQSGIIQSQGTVKIADLQGWCEDQCEKARRARNRSARGVILVEPASRSDGDRIFELYANTLGRHQGRLRYTRTYFGEIADRCCLVAKLDKKVVGFVCYGLLDGRACYLHGGHDPDARSHYPSDLLFRRMILDAKKSGAGSFDFLPSPRGQRSLDRYKLAWGGEIDDFLAVDIQLRRVRAEVFRGLRLLADMIHGALVLCSKAHGGQNGATHA